jgi:hypothetical protein
MLMLAALAFGTQCVTACAATDCAATAKQHNHCGKHRQPAAPEMPAYAICTYLPSAQAITTAPPVLAYAHALTPITAAIPPGGVRFDRALVGTGPPNAVSSFFLVLKI